MTSPQQITSEAKTRQLVTMRIHQQLLGIPVEDVREILREQKITKIPLVPEEVTGALNLRGRIVTVIDIRHRLQLPPLEEGAKYVFVVIEFKGELYSLIVDSVDDVLNISPDLVQDLPKNLSNNWCEISSGVYKLNSQLLIILNSKSLFTYGKSN